MFELITRTPLFPGDSEGLQVLEQSCVLGSPTAEEMSKLSEIVDAPLLQLVKRAGNIPRVDIVKLINSDVYSARDAAEAADLIQNLLKWVPWERLSAKAAMQHPFLKDTTI